MAGARREVRKSGELMKTARLTRPVGRPSEGETRKRLRRGTGVWEIAAGLLLAGCAWAGSLDPTNAPGPTMHSLDEIYYGLDWISTNQAGIIVTTNVVIRPQKTGQTNSYRPGDDDDLQKGVPPPSPRFTVNAASNTVLDNLTGLMWVRNANIWGLLTWSNAVDSCNNLVWSGYDDWRMPNRRELESMIDYGQRNPALPPRHPFTDVELERYWTSSSLGVGNAWGVDLDTGAVGALDKPYVGYTWPVRGRSKGDAK